MYSLLLLLLNHNRLLITNNKFALMNINLFLFRLMRVVRFKPESYQYFGNSKIFYVTGTIQETLLQDEQIILRKGSICQLYFTADTPNFDREKLYQCRILRPRIEDFTRDCRVKGRRGLRLLVESFDEDDIWFNY